MKHLLPSALLIAGATMAGISFAKLPPPSDAAKAAAAEAGAKTAWQGRVDNFMLCKSMDDVAARYVKAAKAAGKETKPATATAACADPGPFVYTPPAPATAAASAPTAPAAAAPTAAAKPAAPAAPTAAPAAAPKKS